MDAAEASDAKKDWDEAIEAASKAESKVAELKKSQDKIASLEQLLTEQAQKHQTVRTELEERLLSGLKDRQQLAADKDLLMQVQMDAMEEIHSKKVLEV